MKSNKGFTLVELLLTIVIIGIIAVLGIAVYTGLSQRSRQRLYESTISLIETKSEAWADDQELKEPITITVNRLVLEGYFDADDELGNVKNPLYPDKGSQYLNCYTVFIEFIDGKSQAKYLDKEDCSLLDTEGNDDNIILDGYAASTNSLLTKKKENDAYILDWIKDNVNLVATATAYEGSIKSYQWYQNGNTIAGATSNKLSVTTDHLLNAKYKVRLEVTNTDGTTSLKFQELTVRLDKEKPTKPEITANKSNEWVNTNPITTTIQSTDLGSGIDKYKYCVVNVLAKETADRCKIATNWLNFTDLNGTVYKLKITDTNLSKYTFQISEPAAGKGLDLIVYFKAIDKVTNESVASTGGEDGDDGFRFKIDTSKPELKIDNPYHNIWAPEAYTVKLTGTEPGGADVVKSGISHYEYCYATTSTTCNTASNWKKYEYSAVSPYTTPKLTTDGRYLFRVYDNSGNVSNTVETIVKIFKKEAFVYTSPGAYTFTAKSKGIYRIELWGSGGAGAGSGKGGGGYVAAHINLNQGQVLYIYVGGQGTIWNSNCTDQTGGYNGGGARGAINYGAVQSCGASGGGATDVRMNGTSLNDRVMVAGGGGGTGYGSFNIDTGAAGGLNGSRGMYANIGDDNLSNYSVLSGYGGTQTSGGQAPATYYAQWGTNVGRTGGAAGGFGYGGAGGNNSHQWYSGGQGSGAGGGGGWYGGSGGSGADSAATGGGGGSSCIYGYTTCNRGSATPAFYNFSFLSGTVTQPAKNNLIYGEHSQTMANGNAGSGYAKISALEGLN